MAQLPERVNTVVVGGGPAGACTSRVLQKAGREHVVLERGRAFEAWRSRRWDGFRVNTPIDQTRLVDQDDGLDDSTLGLPRDAIVDLWARHVAKHALPIFEECDVVAVEPADTATPDGPLRVHVQRPDGPAVIEALNVIGAVGSYHAPALPDFAASISPSIRQAPVGSGYTNPEALPSGNVLIVGSGQSGSQIADEIADAGGRTVFLATSACAGCPRNYRGIDLFEWVKLIKLQEQDKSTVPNLEELYKQNPPVAGAVAPISPFSLARKGVRLLGHAVGVDTSGLVLTLADDLRKNVDTGVAGYNAFCGAFEGFYSANKEAVPEATEIVPEKEWEPCQQLVDQLEGPATTELDLAKENITCIVWATGWSADFSWVKVPGVREAFGPHGKPTDGKSPHPGMFWMGMPWQQTRGSNLVVGFPADAVLVASHLREE